MKITKQQVLENLEDVKKYIQEAEEKKEEKVLGIAIKNRLGEIIFQSTKTTYKEAIIEKGDKNLSYTDLSNTDLSGANLSGANLRGADLYGADLYGADLYGADLYCADLRGANLYGADLSNTDLRGAKFYGKGGSVVIMKKDLDGFLGALGFKLED